LRQERLPPAARDQATTGGDQLPRRALEPRAVGNRARFLVDATDPHLRELDSDQAEGRIALDHLMPELGEHRSGPLPGAALIAR